MSLTLAGCAAGPAPAPVEPSVPSLPRGEPEPAETPAPMPEPRRPARPPVVDALVAEARRHVGAGDCAGAKADAERGLRIDRQVPEFYLVLAKCYAYENERHQSQQFARQGLRYARPGSAIARSLNTLAE